MRIIRHFRCTISINLLVSTHSRLIYLTNHFCSAAGGVPTPWSATARRQPAEMASALRLRWLLLLLAVVAAATWPCAGAGRVDLWPMPASVTRGALTLLVSKDLKLSTVGSSYPDGKGILREAFQRMVAVVELDHAINGTYSQGAPVLAGVRVAVRSPNDEVRAPAQF